MCKQIFIPNKKPAILLVLLVLPLMAMLPWKVKKLQEYFPMKEGNVWQYNVFYRSDYTTEINDSIFCTGDTVMNGMRYKMISPKKGELIFPAGYWRFDKAKLYRYHSVYKQDVLVVDFEMRRGETFEYPCDTLRYRIRVLSTDTMYKANLPQKISTADEPVELPLHTKVYCVEYTEVKSATTAILFFREGYGLLGLRMKGDLEMYLWNCRVW